MSWTWWTWETETMLYRIGAGSLAVEGLLALVFLVLTWLLRPDLIQSRHVVGAMMALSGVVSIERGFAALGHPLGAVGQVVVALVGAVVIVSAAVYHTTLHRIPRPEQLTEAMERIAEAQTEAARARAEAAAATERALRDCRVCLDQGDQTILSLRRSVEVAGG